MVILDGRSVNLTRTEYRLLVVLASRPDEVLSREMLGKLVWGYEDIGTGHLIDVHIGRLRLKLRRASSSGLVIATVRGKGYTLGAGSSNPAGEGEGDDGPRSSSGSPRREFAFANLRPARHATRSTPPSVRTTGRPRRFDSSARDR